MPRQLAPTVARHLVGQPLNPALEPSRADSRARPQLPATSGQPVNPTRAAKHITPSMPRPQVPFASRQPTVMTIRPRINFGQPIFGGLAGNGGHRLADGYGKSDLQSTASSGCIRWIDA